MPLSCVCVSSVPYFTLCCFLDSSAVLLAQPLFGRNAFVLPIVSETHLTVQQVQMWPFLIGSCDNSVGELLRLKAGWPGNQSSIYCSYKKPCSSPAVGPTQFPSRGTEGSSPGDKQSPASSAVVKDLTALSYVAIMMRYIIKQRDKSVGTGTAF